MATTADNPPSAARVKALHRLHAVGAARGLSHEDLRAACGVPSLSRLSTDDVLRHADRLEADRPQPRRRYRSGRQPLMPGEIRSASDATTRQRRRIDQLLDQLAWSPASGEHWLAARHNVRLADLRGNGFIDRSVASAIITQLDRVAAKSQSITPSVHQSLPQEVRS